MADTRYNLDTLVSKYIHRPIIKGEDLPPLYARTNPLGENGPGAEYECAADIDGMKNPAWQKNVLIRYNSPTNVRRLFIGDKKVTIQYYQPPVNKTAKGAGEYWVTYSYDNKDNLSNIVNTVLNYNKLVMENAMGGREKPERYIVTRTGLGALSNNWKMSNIEEVYITPSILISEDIRTQFPESEQMLMQILSNPVGTMAKSDLPLKIFEYANGFNIKNIRTRFPRLRTVAFATNLEQAMDITGAMKLREGLPAQLSENGLRWVIHMNNLGIKQVSTIVISSVPFSKTSLDVEFQIRPGVYKFDAEILVPYFEKYKAKILELGRQQRDAELGIKRDEEKSLTKSDYEQYLDTLLAEKGNAVVTAAIQLSFARSTKEEIDKEFDLMSAEGKQKYRQMLGR